MIFVGLAIGALVGFVASLFRFRDMKSAVTISTIGLVALMVIPLVSLLFVKSGDAYMASVTLVAIGLAVFVVCIAFSLIVGAILTKANGFRLVDNMRSCVGDFFALALLTLTIGSMLFNYRHESERSRSEEYRAGQSARIQRMVSVLPTPYNVMNDQELRGTFGQVDRGEIQVDTRTRGMLNEVRKAQDEVSNSYSHDYKRDERDRIGIAIGALVGWIISAVVTSVRLRRSVGV